MNKELLNLFTLKHNNKARRYSTLPLRRGVTRCPAVNLSQHAISSPGIYFASLIFIKVIIDFSFILQTSYVFASRHLIYPLI